MTQKNQKKIIGDAVRILRRGGVIAYPTDTTYGVGCAVSNLTAIDKIFELKGRDFTKPLSVAFSSIEMVRGYADLPAKYDKVLQEYLPGSFTFLLNKKKLIDNKITAGLPKVGVRIPNYDLTLQIIEKLGEPIITTSANISGRPDVVRSDDLKLKVDYIVPGECLIKIPSTLIDLENAKILREGAGAKTAQKIIQKISES